MTRSFYPPGELLLGLIALERAAIDSQQLIAAFETWTRSDEPTMREILLGQVRVEPARLAELEEAVALMLRHGDQPPIDAAALSATVAHIPREGQQRISSSGGRPLPATAEDGRFRVIRPLATGGLGSFFSRSTRS